MEPNTPNQNHGDTSPPNSDTTKEKNLRLFQRGITWMAAGVGIMGFSFMLQFFLFQADNQAFVVPMYVLTSIGALLVMKGFIDAFGF